MVLVFQSSISEHCEDCKDEWGLWWWSSLLFIILWMVAKSCTSYISALSIFIPWFLGVQASFWCRISPPSTFLFPIAAPVRPLEGLAARPETSSQHIQPTSCPWFFRGLGKKTYHQPEMAGNMDGQRWENPEIWRGDLHPLFHEFLGKMVDSPRNRCGRLWKTHPFRKVMIHWWVVHFYASLCYSSLC